MNGCLCIDDERDERDGEAVWFDAVDDPLEEATFDKMDFVDRVGVNALLVLLECDAVLIADESESVCECVDAFVSFGWVCLVSGGR